MGQNKTVGADSISARDVVRSCTGSYRMHFYDSTIFERCAAPRTTYFIIYYLLSII